MKKNQRGFSIVETIIVITIVGLLGAVGWLVYDRQKSKEDNKQETSKTSQQSSQDTKETPKNTSTYSFKELGISMEIVNGWEVKPVQAKDNGANVYTWTVQKGGAKADIVFRSGGFLGGFGDCDDSGKLSPVKVSDTAATKNKKFIYMTWTSGEETTTNIVGAEEKVFHASAEASSPVIQNKDVKVGDYFMCLSSPSPGFSLGLNKETNPTNFSRRDTIRVVQGIGLGANGFTPGDQSYDEIKTMLTSIK